MVVVGFKSDVGGGVVCFFVSYVQGVYFSMWFVGVIVKFFVDDFVVFYNDVVDVRVRMGSKVIVCGKFQCMCYVYFVLYGLVL